MWLKPSTPYESPAIKTVRHSVRFYSIRGELGLRVNTKCMAVASRSCRPRDWHRVVAPRGQGSLRLHPKSDKTSSGKHKARLVEEAAVDAVLPEELIQSQLPAANPVSVPIR